MATAVLTSTVKVAAFPTMIKSAELGFPPTPVPPVNELQFLLVVTVMVLPTTKVTWTEVPPPTAPLLIVAVKVQVPTAVDTAVAV